MAERKKKKAVVPAARKKSKEAVQVNRKKTTSLTPAKALEKIVLSLKEKGASRGKVVGAKDIVVDERVRLKCQIPLCDSYNRNLMCPPRLPTITLFRNALAKFSRAILIQVSAELEKPDDAFLHAKKLHELVNQGEKEAFEEGFRFAAGLIGGCCRLCETCVAADPRTAGAACRFPFKARPSMEAMGIDVIATVEAAGWSSAFPVTNHVTWTGLILV
jgi:predicted metal-binding protein